MAEKILFGAVYILEQDYTEEEIYRDLLNMKNDGYQLITLWPVLNTWVAKSTHDFVYTETVKVLDILEKLGMKAILQLFGQNQSQEFMPDSALTAEMMIHDERGETFNENCFWANLNHPIVREYMDKYFKSAIESLKGHPAVYGFDVFNEAHFRSDDAYTVSKYQKWLKERYGSIERLNALWYRRYEGFHQITPLKRKSGYSVWSSLLPEVEYEKFRSEDLDEICRFLYETAKKYDDIHPIMIDGTSAHILATDVTLRNNNEFDTAFIPDIYGATFYPKSWGKNYKDRPWTLSMYYQIPAAAARRAKKPYIINELQTHTQSLLTPGSEVHPSELRNWIWMNVFEGCMGVQLWRWRPFLHGYQAGGRGLTRMDGTPNERSEEVRQLVSILNEYADVFSGARTMKPIVRFGVSYENRLYFDSLLKWQGSFWADNVDGWYKAFWSMGIKPEFMDVENITECDMKTPVIVLPSLLYISEKARKNLAAYVDNGGILVADARLGALDENANVPSEGLPGNTLSEVFGIREKDVTSGGKFFMNAYEKEQIGCGFMEQILETTSDNTTVIGRMEDGSAAVTEHVYGNGRTIYFNSFMGLSLDDCLHQGVMDKLKEILYDIQENMLIEKPETVHTSVMKNNGYILLLVVNFSDEEQEITLKSGWNAKSGLNLMTKQCIKDEHGIKTIKIAAGQTEVYTFV